MQLNKLVIAILKGVVEYEVFIYKQKSIELGADNFNCNYSMLNFIFYI